VIEFYFPFPMKEYSSLSESIQAMDREMAESNANPLVSSALNKKILGIEYSDVQLRLLLSEQKCLNLIASPNGVALNDSLIMWHDGGHSEDLGKRVDAQITVLGKVEPYVWERSRIIERLAGSTINLIHVTDSIVIINTSGNDPISFYVCRADDISKQSFYLLFWDYYC